MRLNPLPALATLMRRLLGRNPEPQDPYAFVGAPLRRGPAGRSAAVALAEPDEPSNSSLYGRRL